jgi:hypothetical protein
LEHPFSPIQKIKFSTIPNLSFLGNLLALPRGETSSEEVIYKLGVATLVTGAANSKSRERNFRFKECENSFTSLHY